MVGSIVEGLRNYIVGCPLLEGFGISINWKEDDPDSAGIIEDSTETAAQYLSGARLKRLHASIYLGALSDADFLRLKNSAFSEDIRKYFIAQNNVRDLPELPDGFAAVGIETSEGSPFEWNDSGRKCTYRIPVILEYIEEDVQ